MRNSAGLILGLLVLACVIGSGRQALADQPKVQPGDAAVVDLVVTSQSGLYLADTLGKAERDPSVWARGYKAQEQRVPELVQTGQPYAKFPGIEREVVGMSPGETKRIELPPLPQAGKRDAAKIKAFPTESAMPDTVNRPIKEFVAKTNHYPKVGETAEYNPLLKATVKAVGDVDYTLALEPLSERLERADGIILGKKQGNRLVFHYQAKVGAYRSINGRFGKIIAADDKTYTMDFNNQLAEQSLSAEIRVRAVIPVAALTKSDHPWGNDIARAFTMATASNKPVLFLIYSSKCEICHHLMDQDLKSPQAMALDDSFIWLRIDVEDNHSIMDEYKALEYPTVIIYTPQKQEQYRHTGDFDSQDIWGQLFKFSKL